MSEQNSFVAVPPAIFPPDDSVTGVPPKRKKGRPRKNRDLIPLGNNIVVLPPKPDGRGRKTKRKFGDVVLQTADSAFIGQQVHGVLDGSFDAGYLLTVRIANTEIVLQGVVFEPSLSVPVSESNDIAPNVKFIGRFEEDAPTQYLSENANKALPAPTIIVPCANSDPMAGGHKPTQEGAKSAPESQAVPPEVGRSPAAAIQAVPSAGYAVVPPDGALSNCSVQAEALNRSVPLPTAATECPKGVVASLDTSGFATEERMDVQGNTQPSQVAQFQNEMAS